MQEKKKQHQPSHTNTTHRPTNTSFSSMSLSNTRNPRHTGSRFAPIAPENMRFVPKSSEGTQPTVPAPAKRVPLSGAWRTRNGRNGAAYIAKQEGERKSEAARVLAAKRANAAHLKAQAAVARNAALRRADTWRKARETHTPARGKVSKAAQAAAKAKADAKAKAKKRSFTSAENEAYRARNLRKVEQQAAKLAAKKAWKEAQKKKLNGYTPVGGCTPKSQNAWGLDDLFC